MSQCGWQIWPYCIDWEITAAMLTGVGTLLGAISILVAALVARERFNEWTAKSRFQSDRAQAVSILEVFEKARFALKQIRSPVTLASEAAMIDKKMNETGLGDTQGNRVRVTANLRLQREQKVWDEIFELLPIAKVLFGSPVRDALFVMVKARQEVWAAAETYSGVGTDTELAEKLRKRFWLADPDVDELTKVLNDAEDTLVSQLSPAIKGSPPSKAQK